ncbi:MULTISPECIES: hypothetical protein [Bacillus cereus group]|uniref:hypothetical protein n=1 Tax=Bacillus cereus group TaxID=86661 RepID=UPI0021D05E3D|nr:MULTISPECIES: hypothetical protein [Bacillus cereus group]MCU5201639.1 hypothetical protein [Bacillus paranthracis]MCU5374719.1 hypothetical protein [Bacillus pacificus]
MSESNTNRPKQKIIRMRKKENPAFVEWLDNQDDFSDSVRKLVELHISRHGTKDINSQEVALSMAKELIFLSEGISIPKTVQAVPTQHSSVQVTEEVPVVEEKQVQEETKEEKKEEIQETEKVEESVEEIKKEEVEEKPKRVKRVGASASNF